MLLKNFLNNSSCYLDNHLCVGHCEKGAFCPTKQSQRQNPRLPLTARWQLGLNKRILSYTFIAFFILIIVFLSGCQIRYVHSWAFPTLLPTLSEIPQVWIDDPIPGDVIPPGKQIVIRYHASNLNGIARMELIINGKVLVAGENNDPRLPQMAVETPWMPPTSGIYTIQVRAQNQAGEWNESSIVEINVLSSTDTPAPLLPTTIITPLLATPPTLAPPTLTFTPIPTSTVATSTPVNTSTPTHTATPPAAIISNVSVSTDHFYCAREPHKLIIDAHIFDPAGIESGLIFYRLSNKTDGDDKTVWMKKEIADKGDRWSVTLNGNFEITETLLTDDAWFEFQFVVTNKQNIITRSKVITGVTYTKCLY
jgi:hypothetical protein